MADEFDDIFGDITPTKEGTSTNNEIEETEETEDITKAPSMSTEFDSMLLELDDAMQTTSSSSATDDFSDIFGDISPSKSDQNNSSSSFSNENSKSKNKDKDKNKFRSEYEKDDFMGWLKEEDQDSSVTSPSNTRSKRSGSTMSEDFGDIFGDTSLDTDVVDDVDDNKKLNNIDEDNDGNKKVENENKKEKSDRPRMFSDDESDKTTPSDNDDEEEEDDDEEESDDDLDFVIHSAPTVSTDDDLKQNNQAAQDLFGVNQSSNEGGDSGPKFYEKTDDGQLKSSEQTTSSTTSTSNNTSSTQSKTSSFLSSMTGSSSSSNKPSPSPSSTSTSSSKFLSGIASSFSTSTMSSKSAATSQNTATGGGNTPPPSSSTPTQASTPTQSPALKEPDTRALEAAFALVEEHRKVLAEEREAAATAGVTPGTRAGFLAALQFRLSPNNVNVARVRMLSAKMGHVVPAEMRPKVWAHLLLGSDLWEDKAFHAWDESEKKTEYPVYQQLLADSKRISSKDVETEEMSALLAFFCYRRDASEYAQALLSCSYPLVKLKLESRAITSSCFYSFTSSLTPGLMLPKKTRFDLIQEYHHAFKLLLSYHDPLLAQHLDRRVVDWHLPPNTPNTDHVLQMTAQEDDTSTNPSTKKSDLLGDGQVPSAALTALFSELLPLSHLYPLWDHLLGCSLGIQSTDKNKDGISSGEGRLLQPFLLLSLLLREHASLVTFDGDVLIQSLKKCLSLVNFSAQGNDSNSGSGVSSFMIDDDVNNDKEEDKEEDVKKKAIEDAKADVSRLEDKLETASQALAIAVEKKNEMEAKELKSKEDGEKDNTEKDGEKEKEEDEDEKSLTKQLEELEENKKQAASEKNFKLAGSIAKEIKALKEKIASSDSGVTLKERKENVDAAISAVGIAKTLLEDATSKLNALTQSEDGTPPLPSSNTSSSASPFAACHIDRLKQCVGAQEWLVYAGLGCYLTGFAAKEINLLDDILDPELCSDEDLTSPPIFMSNKDMKYFRKLVNACSTNQDGEEGGETQKKQSNHRDIEFSLHYQAQGPTTQEYSEIDISVMQWCLESYELFRRTPTSFIIHALKDAESRHLTKTLEDDDMMNGINNDDDDGSKPSQKEADEEDGGGGGSCLGRFCIEVSVGELVPQLCKAAAHGNDVRGRSASVTAAGQQAQQLKIDKLNPASKSLLERAIDMATLGVMTKGSCSTLQYLGRENAQFQKPRFLCLDCRPGAHITRWGKFATTFSLDTPLDSISQDPEAMERLFSMFSSMSGRAHIVLMGVGPDTSESSLSIMSQSSSQSSRVNNIETCGLKSIEDIHAERSQLAGLVLLFHKHNFPLVSVLEGGFAAAHLFLSQMSQLRMIPGSNSLPECGLHDLIDVGQPVKKSFFSTISAPSVKLPSYSMSTSSSTFSLSTSSLLSSSSTAPSGGSTSRYAFSSLRPKSSVNEGSESDTQRNSLTPTNDDGGGGDVNDKKLDKEEETSQDTESPSRPSEGASESEIGSEAKALAAEALEMMANANMAHNDSEPEPARESVSSMRTAFNFSSMADRLMSSSKQPSATTKATQSDESPQCEEGSSASLPVDDVKKLADTPNKTPDTTPPAPSSTPSSSTTSTTSAAAAAAASSMYSSMSNMRFSFASKTQTQPATPAPAPKVAPPAAPSSEELEALQNKALTHGHRLDCGGLEKGEVSIAHMKVAGLLKGSEVIINGETFPNAALFRCQKLKMKSEEFGSVKLSEVPRVDRAIVITKDRVLVLNYAVKDDNVTPSAVVTDDVVGDDQKKTEERVSIGNESNIDKNDNKSSNENNVGNDNNIEDKTKETQNQEPSNKEAEDKKMTIQSDQGVETASQLTSLGAIVKSNHHLTEIVKMTMLKKEPDILTLHFRAGASYDTSTLEGVRRRAYKMHGGKDEFIECLQVAMERFI